MNIPSLRGALGLSQGEFGQLLGVHLMTVSKWERGITQPSPFQRALLDEFERASDHSDQLKAEVRTRLAGRGVVAALLFLLVVASREDERYASGNT